MEMNIHQCSCGERWGHGLEEHVQEAMRHHARGHKVVVGDMKTLLAQQGKVIANAEEVLQVPNPLNPSLPLGGIVTEFAAVNETAHTEEVN